MLVYAESTSGTFEWDFGVKCGGEETESVINFRSVELAGYFGLKRLPTVRFSILGTEQQCGDLQSQMQLRW